MDGPIIRPDLESPAGARLNRDREPVQIPISESVGRGIDPVSRPLAAQRELDTQTIEVRDDRGCRSNSAADSVEIECRAQNDCLGRDTISERQPCVPCSAP